MYLKAMFERSIVILALACLCAVGCSEEKRPGTKTNAKATTAQEIRLIVVSPEHKCRWVVEFPGKEYDIVLCSIGEVFVKESATDYSGDGIRVLKRSAGQVTAIRRLDELDSSQIPFRVEILSDQQNNPAKAKITVASDEYPDWKPAPLFAEEVDLTTGTATVRILKAVRRFDSRDVAKRFAEINVSLDEIDRRAKKMNLSRDGLIYGHLLALRDYGFWEPALIEGHFSSLGHWDWNDGEVAEVAASLKAQVAYMKGKRVEKEFLKSQ